MISTTSIADSPIYERGGGQISHMLLTEGQFGSRNLTVTWVEGSPGSQQDLHAHADSEQVYVIIRGRGVMVIEGEEQEVTTGTAVFIPKGARHAIRNARDELLVYISVTSPPFAAAFDGETWVSLDMPEASSGG